MPAASGLVIGNVDRSLVEALRASGIEPIVSKDGAALEDGPPPDVVCLAFSLAGGVPAPVEAIGTRFPDAAILLIVPAREVVAGEAVARLLDADLAASPLDSRRATLAIRRLLARRERRSAHASLVARARALDPDFAASVEALARDHETTARALDDALAFRSIILSNLAHEVRTPLAVVQGFVDLLEDDFGAVLDADQRELVQAIRSGCSQLVAVFQGLVDLARAETGQVDRRPASVFLPDLLADVAREATPAIEKRPVRFVLDVDRRLGWIRTEPDWVRQIVACLISNAAKFTHEGEIRLSARMLAEGETDPPDPVTVLVRAPTRVGTAVEIEIADTGVGIAPEQQARVFEAFRQEDGSMTRAHEGLGIGLTVVRELATELRATLQLESRPGIGTTVRLRFPIDPARGEAPAAERVSRKPGPAGADAAPGDLVTEIARLHRLAPASFDEAVPLALHALDRGTGVPMAFFASGGAGTWRIVDVAGDAAASSAPPAALLDRAAAEGRASADAGPSDRWYAVAVRGAPGSPLGALACRAPTEIEAHVWAALQTIGGWLGLVQVVRAVSAERVELAATISRSIKDPLGSLLAYTQVLLRGLRGSLTEEQRSIVLRVEKGIHRSILSALDLLDFERALAPRATDVARPFPIASVVDHVLARHASALELARVAVDRSGVGSVECVGDDIRTDRALSALLRAFVDGGPSSGAISLAAHTDDSRVVLELRGRVTDPSPFERAFSDAPVRLGFDELLGLALARVAIEAQGGTITLRRADEDTIIAIAMPRAPARPA